LDGEDKLELSDFLEPFADHVGKLVDVDAAKPTFALASDHMKALSGINTERMSF
jgi:hypothetical protein